MISRPNLLADSRGSVTLLNAALLLILISMMGLAIDVGMWNTRRDEMQSLADSAAMAGARAMSLDGEYGAVLAARNHLLQKGADPSLFEIKADIAGSEVTVASVDRTQQRYLSIFMLQAAPELSVSAVAKFTRHQKLCVLATDPNANPGIVLRGDGELTGSSCVTWSNSLGKKSLSVEKAITVTLAKMCAAGAAFNTSKGTVTPWPTENCDMKPDPLEGFFLQVPTGCDHVKYESQEPFVQLYPGTYCGGITVVSDNVVAAPGIYYIKDGDVDISGTSEVRFEQATIYLSGKDLGLSVKGDSRLTISAPLQGDTKDIAVAMDPAGVPAKQTFFGGSSRIYISGAVHVPQQKLVISGDSVGVAELDNAMLIAKQVDFGGGSEWKWVATDRLPDADGVEVRLVR